MIDQFDEDKAECFENLKKELIKAYSAPIEIVTPHEWNQTYYSWFQAIEQNSFRQELRYTYEEILERWNNPRKLLIFVLRANIPEAIILGYNAKESSEKVFFLDTIAVNTQRKGIGKILMNFIIQWAREEHFQAIMLDTEEYNERGFPSSHFYKKLGFEVIENKDGNIRLIRSL